MSPYLEKNTLQKRAGGVAQGVDPEFKPQYHTHKKEKVLCNHFSVMRTQDIFVIPWG
jgi:hypothetical protein